MIVNNSVQSLHDLSEFLSSTAAQVWAAFLIFIVLLLRDMAAHKKMRSKEIWREARLLWRDLLTELREARAPILAQSSWGLDSDTLDRADTDFASFQRLLEAITSHQIVSKLGKAQTGLPFTQLHFHRRLSSDEWQRTFDILTAELLDINRDLAQPLRSLRLGLFATAANLSFIGLQAFVTETSRNLHIITASLLILNFSIGRIFYSQLKQSLRVMT